MFKFVNLKTDEYYVHGLFLNMVIINVASVKKTRKSYTQEGVYLCECYE
jgi:hypothetical protein